MSIDIILADSFANASATYFVLLLYFHLTLNSRSIIHVSVFSECSRLGTIFEVKKKECLKRFIIMLISNNEINFICKSFELEYLCKIIEKRQ